MSLVLDSSVTLARIFPDEWTAEVLRVFDEEVLIGAWVPNLWKIEVANVLSLSVRKGRITKKYRDESLADLSLLRIITDVETDSYSWTDTLVLADKYRLSAYDATYLELSLRLSLPLATLDKELRTAAALEGVELLGL